MKKKIKSNEMPFWDHIYELRNRIFFILISVCLITILAYIFFQYYFTFFYNTLGENLYATHIAEGFITKIRISFLLGIILSIPIIILQIVLFVFPALKKKEKIIFFSIVLFSFLLFVFGIIFSLKTVMPISINFFKSRMFFPDNVERLLSYNRFITFFFQFIIGFGVCFQFPVVIILLLKLKLISIKSLIINLRYVIVGCFIVSAILTPPDVVSQILLGLPMVILYLLSILIGVIFRLGK